MNEVTTESGNVSAPELLRYFSPEIGGLVSVREDGCAYLLRPFRSGVWIKYAEKKPEVPLDKWCANKRAAFALLPYWQKSVTELPDDATLNRWLVDGVCETPDGDEVEPDGRNCKGVPSWLVALKLM
ncbi:MAG: hypothetical protein JNJ60_24355 [Rhodocyclaceae bacterium]|nr:hypothetical protein [Rhodocyclaceae bacterium]